MTQWTVTASASHVALDPGRRGTVAMSVTNLGQASDVAVFGAVPADGADLSWFTVAEPQRPVPPGGSVSYQLNIAVPAHAPAGRYAVAGRVYSANQPPEETSRTSGWILFDVGAARVAPGVQPGPPHPPRQRLWPIAVAAAVGLVVVLVLGWVVIWPWLTGKHEGVIEAEHMQVLDPEWAATDIHPHDDSASEEAHLLFPAWEPGLSLTVEFSLPASGEFDISAIRSMSPDHGTVVLTVDEKPLGEEFDGYQPEFGFTDWETVGTIELSEGPHKLTMTIQGNSANAGNFYAGLDAIRYEST
jgi:hypothetical protein